jgi:hypothetical protein
VKGYSFVRSVNIVDIKPSEYILYFNLRVFFITQIHIRASSRVVQDWLIRTGKDRPASSPILRLAMASIARDFRNNLALNNGVTDRR